MNDSTCQKILITGAYGMIGAGLLKALRQKYGRENVIASNWRKRENAVEKPFQLCDITNLDQLDSVVTSLEITWLINMSAVVSAASEADHLHGMKVNMLGFQNVMEVARKHRLRVLHAGSAASFGPSTPKDRTPDLTIMRPTSIYGICKLENELVGEYYHRRFGVDFRCLRIPSVITDEAKKSGRLHDYTVDIFPAALGKKHFTVELEENGRLAFVHLNDLVEGAVKFLEAPEAKLTQRVYNVANLSLTPGELVVEIREHVHGFEVDFKPNEIKANIIKSMPDSLDDSIARRDWGWQPTYDLAKTVAEILEKVKNRQTD